MEEIKIRKIQEPSVKLYNPNGKLVEVMDNILSFLDVRLQISQKQISRYHIEYNEEIIGLSEYGRIERHLPGLFDQVNDLLDKILEG